MYLKAENKRILLRPIALGDAAVVLRYKSDKLSNRFQEWIPQKESDVLHFIQRRLSADFNHPGSWFQYVIYFKKIRKICGDLGIHFHETNPEQCELGITLAKEFQGKGIAKESIKMVTDCLFSDYKKKIITALIDVENLSSIRCFVSCGFMEEGRFAHHSFVRGEWRDDIRMCLHAR